MNSRKMTGAVELAASGGVGKPSKEVKEKEKL